MKKIKSILPSRRHSRSNSNYSQSLMPDQEMISTNPLSSKSVDMRDIKELQEYYRQALSKQSEKYSILWQKNAVLTTQKKELSSKLAKCEKENKTLKTELSNVKEERDNILQIYNQMEEELGDCQQSNYLILTNHQKLKQQHENIKYEQQLIMKRLQEREAQINTLKVQKMHIQQDRDKTRESLKRIADELRECKIRQMMESPYSKSTLSCCNEEESMYDMIDYENMKSQMMNHGHIDPELCLKLQENLENYIADSRRKGAKKIGKFVLKVLRLFHEDKGQIVRIWESLGRNQFEQLSVELEEIFETKMERDDSKYDDVVPEELAYKVLFDIVLWCNERMKDESYKIRDNLYLDPKVIDMILMNMNIFREIELPENNKVYKIMRKRIPNIFEYINGIMGDIMTKVTEKYGGYELEDEVMNKVKEFMVNCCEIIWSILHYNYELYTRICDNEIMDLSGTRYNDKVHEKKGGYEGDNIEYAIFPGIKSDRSMITKVWVICDDEDEDEWRI